MIEPVPKHLSAIECVELAETMLEHRYGTEMARLAETEPEMAAVMYLTREARERAGADLSAKKGRERGRHCNLIDGLSPVMC
jgi:hypothetical protein